MYKIEKYLEELFRRTLFFIFSFLLTFTLFYSWSFDLFLFLSESLNLDGSQKDLVEGFSSGPEMHHGIHKFIFTDITEAFQTSLSISFIMTFCFHIPFFIYTLWCFCVPSFLDEERSLFTLFILLFLGVYSIACGVMVVVFFPKIWHFFLTFQLYDSSLQIECEPRISSFSSFLWKTFLFTQALFQIPLMLFISLFYEFLHHSFFFESRRIIYWILLSVCAFIAPPDFFVQFYFSLSVLCLFEMTLLSALILKTYRYANSYGEL